MRNILKNILIEEIIKYKGETNIGSFFKNFPSKDLLKVFDYNPPMERGQGPDMRYPIHC